MNSAREKASQVLRDAIGLQFGIPTSAISNSGGGNIGKRKTPEESKVDSGIGSSPEKRGRLMTSPLLQMRRGSPERVQSGVAVPPTWGGGGGGSTPSYPMVFPPTASASSAPPYLPVTPSFSTSRRKRQRAYETPDAFANVYNPVYVAMNSSPSPASGYTPPMPPPGPPPPPPPNSYHNSHRPYVNFPSHPGSSNTQPGRVTDSFHRAGGRSSSLYQYPVSSARNSLGLGFLDDVPPPPPPHDFDLFNGELLSDQSDRDGAVSPAASYPYAQQIHDRRESL